MKAEFHFAGEPVAFAVVEPSVMRILIEGRAKIAKGWCRFFGHVYRPENLGGDLYCALGAVGGTGAAEWLKAALPPGYDLVCSYNDAPGRTQVEVLALFDRAIALARAA